MSGFARISTEPAACVPSCSTLVELLAYRAEVQPADVAFIYLIDGEKEQVQLTYSQLHQKAIAIALMLHDHRSDYDKALLLYNSGLKFIEAFFGCLYSGIIAIPAYLPPGLKKIDTLQRILVDSGTRLILSSGDLIEDIQRISFHSSADHELFTWISTSELLLTSHSGWNPPSLTPDSYAFFQYTSGSTHNPKGVMLTHANIIHNQRIIEKAFRHDRDTIGLGWLPHYHDMGLIGNIIQTLSIGRPCILMSPFHFIQRPFRWLKAISDYKATSSGGPNFAYELCARKVTEHQKEELDLTSWRLAFTGAEAIRHDTLMRFAKAFSSCGFDVDAFYPCYGLAEATLFATGMSADQKLTSLSIDKSGIRKNRVIISENNSAESIQFVGCGQAWLNHDVVIAQPDQRIQCSSDEIGEIWFRGASVAQGYWNKPEQTESTFSAFLADSQEGPFLRTGDLGFLRDGHLFITGRIKDLIIIRGQNYYPHEIEKTVENSVEGLAHNGGAAFSIDEDGEERLVIVQEVERTYIRKIDFNGAAKAIRSIIIASHGLDLYAIEFIKPVTIPKTSSGKVQRTKCRDAYLNHQLSTVHSWLASPATKR